tara:strand:+ start:581 stop:1306 length:726 start_codon:yes stop_codon:yes gene_type:complete
MKKRKLGVNIDHVATIRNARGEKYPDPLEAAIVAQRSGANSITIHLREDRRHIKKKDLINLKKKIKIPINLEMAPTKEMLKIALKYKPNYVCIVPEKREELTTEGGLNLNKKKTLLKDIIKKLKKNKIRVSLFIEPKISDVKLSKFLDVDCVELHTGNFCKLFNNNKNTKLAYSNVKKSANFAKRLGLEVHAGHGLTYNSTKKLSYIRDINEFNIGHFIISDSMFIGLDKSIKNFLSILNR